jgi:Na+/H+-dicarboxylate symporter
MGTVKTLAFAVLGIGFVALMDMPAESRTVGNILLVFLYSSVAALVLGFVVAGLEQRKQHGAKGDGRDFFDFGGDGGD